MKIKWNLLLIRILLNTSIILLTCNSVFATETSTNAWYGFFSKSSINDDFSWWTETQLRFDVDQSKMQQALIRTGLLKGFYGSEMGLLYAYIKSDENKEHRLALQHVINYGEYLNTNFSHRIRLEYRSRENRSKFSERFRFLLRAEGDIAPKLKHVVWNEVFLNLKKEDNTGDRVTERNRLFLGGRYNLSKDIDIEAGYLNQFVPRNIRNAVEHTIVFYVFL